MMGRKHGRQDALRECEGIANKAVHLGGSTMWIKEQIQKLMQQEEEK